MSYPSRYTVYRNMHFWTTGRPGAYRYHYVDPTVWQDDGDTVTSTLIYCDKDKCKEAAKAAIRSERAIDPMQGVAFVRGRDTYTWQDLENGFVPNDAQFIGEEGGAA